MNSFSGSGRSFKCKGLDLLNCCVCGLSIGRSLLDIGMSPGSVSLTYTTTRLWLAPSMIIGNSIKRTKKNFADINAILSQVLSSSGIKSSSYTPVKDAIRNSKYVMRANRHQMLHDILNVPENSLSSRVIHLHQLSYVNQCKNGERMSCLNTKSKTSMVMNPMFS